MQIDKTHNKKGLLLASGGVDSSALCYKFYVNKQNIDILHTAYTNHDINDLNKLISLIQIILKSKHFITFFQRI